MHKIWEKIFIIVVVIALLICIGYTNGNSRQVTIIESGISKIITAPQRIYVYFKNWVTKNEKFFSDIKELENENESLKNYIQEIEQKILDYEVLVSENKVLKEHIKTVESYPNYNVVAAEVISDSINNWDEIYIINRGSKHGIMPNMAVITVDGLVGYVESVTDNTSKVVSILDAGNSVSSRVTKTRDAVICKGNTALKEKNQLKVKYIPMGVELIEGDKIETSGMGGIYPKGIAIGTIKEFIIKKNPSENEAILETFVEFNKLETVAVIISETV